MSAFFPRGTRTIEGRLGGRCKKLSVSAAHNSPESFSAASVRVHRYSLAQALLVTSSSVDYLTDSLTRSETNRLDLLQRLPSDLRRYLQYIYDLKRSHGSVLSFVQHERLHWDTVILSGNPPFTDASDHKTLFNDWPYGIDTDITHLVVWTKFPLEDDSKTDDLTPRARREIEEFVDATFCGEGGLRKEQVIWFKNWRSLKSVHALEHFHVMVYKAPKEFLEKMTGGDKPMSEKLKEAEGNEP